MILLALFVQQLFLTYFAYSLKTIVDIVQRHTSSLAWADPCRASDRLSVDNHRRYGWRETHRRASGLLMGDIPRQLFAKLQAMSADFAMRKSPGDILARFTGDLGVIQAGFTQATFITCMVTISLLINIPVMLWLDWRLALLSLLSLPLIRRPTAISCRAQDGRRINCGRRRRPCRYGPGDRSSTVRDQGFRAAKAAHRTLRSPGRSFDGCDGTIGFAIALLGKGSSTLILFVQLVVTTVGAVLALRGDLSAGSLVAFLSILGVVSRDTYEFAKGGAGLDRSRQRAAPRRRDLAGDAG